MTSNEFSGKRDEFRFHDFLVAVSGTENKPCANLDQRTGKCA